MKPSPLLSTRFATSRPSRDRERGNRDHSAQDPEDRKQAKGEPGIVMPLHPTGVGCVGQNAFVAESRLERHAPDAEDDTGHRHEHGGPGDEIQQRRPPGALSKEEQVMKDVARDGENAAATVRFLNDVVTSFGDVVFVARRIVHGNAMQWKIPGQCGNSRELIGGLQISVVRHGGRVLGSELLHPLQGLLRGPCGEGLHRCRHRP